MRAWGTVTLDAPSVTTLCSPYTHPQHTLTHTHTHTHTWPHSHLTARFLSWGQDRDQNGWEACGPGKDLQGKAWQEVKFQKGQIRRGGSGRCSTGTGKSAKSTLGPQKRPPALQRGRQSLPRVAGSGHPGLVQALPGAGTG